MIAVTMGDEHMGRAFRCLVVTVIGQHRVSVEPGVDQQNLTFEFDPQACVSEPDDFHGASPLL